MNLKLNLFEIGTKSNSIMDALPVPPPTNKSRSSSPGQPPLPEEALPIPSFGPEPKRRILIGTYVLSQGYYDA